MSNDVFAFALLLETPASPPLYAFNRFQIIFSDKPVTF